MLDILPQLIVVALITSSLYAVIASGLTLTFGVLEFIHFGYGEMAMAGAFAFYAAFIQWGWPIPAALLFAVIIVTLLGIFIEKTTFKPIRNKHAFLPLVLSIGVAIVLTAIAEMVFGAGSKNYGEIPGFTESHQWFNGSVVITNAQITIILCSGLLITALYLFLKKSKTGKAIRAVADDKKVAAVMGIDVDKTITILFALASALAAVGGILTAFDQNLRPLMGQLITVKAFVVIILGGVGSLKGAIIAAFIIGFIETMSIGLLPIQSSWKELIVFSILILTLIIRPYGLYGGRKEEVESR
jgi:branched-chain amino acid transport system permease protein